MIFFSHNLHRWFLLQFEIFQFCFILLQELSSIKANIAQKEKQIRRYKDEVAETKQRCVQIDAEIAVRFVSNIFALI